MCGYLHIGPGLEGRFEVLACVGLVAQAEFHPSQAVHDEGVVGGKLQGLQDELFGLVQPHPSVRERIAEGVVGVVVVGLARDHLAQQLFHGVGLASLFGEHGLVVDQFRIVRSYGHQFCLHFVGFLVQALVAQQLYFGHEFQAVALWGIAWQAAQQGPCLGELALACQQ